MKRQIYLSISKVLHPPRNQPYRSQETELQFFAQVPLG